jgi:hypothetical protein
MTYQTHIVDTRTKDRLATPVERANTALIRYPRFTKLHNAIQLCQNMSNIAGEPQCMVLEGMPGVGKSTLIKSYTEALPRYETISGTKVPVFYLETPSPATVKGMAAKLLDVLGDPAANHGTLWSMNARLIHFIRACEVQMVILDDFHHLIDRETNRVLHKVSDWLKVLIKETNVPFLVVGIVDTVRRILDANAQLSRLFAIRETLHPFRWDTQQPETIKEFAGFVTFAESKIGIPLATEIDRQDLLYRLYDATDGVVGNIMNLLRYGAAIAQQRENDQLSLGVLATAFDLRLAEHVHKRNPFVTSGGKVLSEAPFAETDPTCCEDKQVSSSADTSTTE